MTVPTSINESESSEDEKKLPREFRRRALKGGILSYQNHFLSIDCVVRNLSQSGAKLAIETDAIVPNKFDLSIPVDGTRVECLVRWRIDNQLGVRFVGQVGKDYRIARIQSLDPEFVVPRSTSILRK